MSNIPESAVNNPEKLRNVSAHRATPVVVVVRRTACPDCGHVPPPEEVVCPPGEGRHRQQTRSWVDLATQVLLRRSMTLRLVLILLVVAVPATAVAAVLALASQLGLI